MNRAVGEVMPTRNNRDNEEGECPFLVPVMVDGLWVLPTTAYCRRPNAAVHVPSRTTVARVCTTAKYLTCSGYQSSVTAR
jgi:hypothetical protein